MTNDYLRGVDSIGNPVAFETEYVKSFHKELELMVEVFTEDEYRKMMTLFQDLLSQVSGLTTTFYIREGVDYIAEVSNKTDRD